MMFSEICSFYNGQNVLITGGTGFLGKVLIEKLLRSTNVGTIFVLIRNKKGKTADQRLDELFVSPLSDKLKAEKPQFRSHVTAIYGDCVVDSLGLSGVHRETLTQNTNIVFHVAATVRFDEHIQKAYEINVKGTESLMKLCREMTFLKAVVYVSTAYSNCHLCSIDEIIYKNDYKYKEVEELLAKLSYQEAKKATPKLLGARPNTYTFTKGLAEEMLKDDFGDLPLAIFRPGAVESMYKDPLENWTDSNGTPNTIFKFTSLGLLRVLPSKDKFLEVVPVDLTISALIASAWDSQNHRKNIPIYNYVSSVDNPLTVYELFGLSSQQCRNFPSKDALWVPKLCLREDSVSTQTLMIVHHYPLAFLLDFFRLLSLKKPQIVYTVKKLHKFIDTIKFFLHRDWQFSNQNVKEMWNKMNPTDRALFNFDITSVQWIYYLRNHFKGLRLYFLKQDLDSLPQAKQKLGRLQIVNEMVQFLTNFFGHWCLVNQFDKMRAKL